MTKYSLVTGRAEDGRWTGVARFDLALRRVFPDLESITPREIPQTFEPDDLVITDNHLVLAIPGGVNAIVVHHGCAATHYERDPLWRNKETARMVAEQKQMTEARNAQTLFWAPSQWVADEFSRHNPNWMREVVVCPNWVEPMDLEEWDYTATVQRRIIGDWRDSNKGAHAWKQIARQAPAGWKFEPLDFREPYQKKRQYGLASVYLCLSLSEGGAYSLSDAEAAGIPIVTTDVGNYREFSASIVIPWQERDNPAVVLPAIERAIAMGRRATNYFTDQTFAQWALTWKEACA